MGADLSRGSVSDKHLVCPLHQWRYSRNGECHAKLPLPLAQQAKLQSLATDEYGGIIFVFPLTSPLYPLPKLPNISKPAISSTTMLLLPIHYLAPTVNTFDVAHYRVIHHREMLQEPELFSNNPYHLGISFTARVIPKHWQDKLMHVLGIDIVDITIDCWGGSMLLMNNDRTKLGAIIAMQPNNIASSNGLLHSFWHRTAVVSAWQTTPAPKA